MGVRRSSLCIFQSVLAHELGHVWLFENEIKLNDMECEGFVNYFRTKFYFQILLLIVTVKRELLLQELMKSMVMAFDL